MRLKITPLLLSLMLLVPMVSSAATVAGVNMEDKTTVNGQTLVLNGAGLRKKFFIKVYVGGFYLPAKMSNPASNRCAVSRQVTKRSGYLDRSIIVARCSKV